MERQQYHLSLPSRSLSWGSQGRRGQLGQWGEASKCQHPSFLSNFIFTSLFYKEDRSSFLSIIFLMLLLIITHVLPIWVKNKNISYNFIFNNLIYQDKLARSTPPLQPLVGRWWGIWLVGSSRVISPCLHGGQDKRHETALAEDFVKLVFPHSTFR